jgi:hypothetical protein
MLFADKYPEAKEGETYEHDNYIYSTKADNCYQCGKLTHFVEINIGAHICSEECDENFYLEAFKHALKKSNIDF